MARKPTVSYATFVIPGTAVAWKRGISGRPLVAQGGESAKPALVRVRALSPRCIGAAAHRDALLANHAFGGAGGSVFFYLHIEVKFAELFWRNLRRGIGHQARAFRGLRERDDVAEDLTYAVPLAGFLQRHRRGVAFFSLGSSEVL